MWVLLVFISCALLCGGGGASKPNFVFILTDDQDLVLNGMVPMTQTVKLIGNKGVTFANAYVNTPICCPSRSTILTGKYVHNTRVTNNTLAGNCSSKIWQTNHEPHSIASILKRERNYNTFYAGKYLNQYGFQKSGGLRHVPPGYDWWIGLQGNSKYYNYTLSVNGTRKSYKNKYLTDVIKNYALDFLNQQHVRRSPFFMMLSPPASHSPFTPAPRHKKRFKDVTVIRNPAFNYSSYDKHWIVAMAPKFLPENVTVLSDIQRGRLQTLLAVDEMIDVVVNKLKELDVLRNTYVIFTSDNGFHIGQFGQPWDKRQPYESDIRVPFLMSGPKIKRKSVLMKPVSTVDIAPTIMDLAEITNAFDMDGRSFKGDVFDVDESNEKLNTAADVYVEYYGEGNEQTIDPHCPFTSSNLSQCTLDNWCKCQDSRNNTYVCVRRISKTTDYKFCQFDDDVNFVEAYDLKVDPFELVNLHRSLTQKERWYYQDLLKKFINNM